jgi:superoxide reductase
MASRLEIYKCEVCGNIVEVLDGGAGELVCCGEPMKRFEEKTADSTKEKHVPVVEIVGTCDCHDEECPQIKVKVGSVPHPMEEKHYIEWIEVVTGDGKAYRQFLEPGGEPEAEFCAGTEEVTAREYCNVHGLWKA